MPRLHTRRKNRTKNVKLVGSRISAGFAIGRAYIYRDILKETHDFYDIKRYQVAEEHDRIIRAMRAVGDDLGLSARRIEKELDTGLADIFRAQGAILSDEALAKELGNELKRELVNAEEAVKRVFHRWEVKFRQMGNDLLSQRADDMADLCRRLLRRLEGIHAHTLEEIPEESVLVAKQLLPSDTVFLSRQSTVAVVVAFGGPGSHAALLTRAIGIPAVGHIPQLLEEVRSGDRLIVDGTSGIVIVSPDTKTLESYKERVQKSRIDMVQAKKRCDEPAITLDGVKIEVTANITCREDLELALENGADGIGLYRVEGLYLSQTVLPSAQELFEVMKYTLQPAADKPLTIRLLDAGGDKRLPFLDLPREDNPFLGRRGIRFLLDYPDLLSTQLETILHLSQILNIRILVPMVTLRDELERVRQMLDTAATKAGVDSVPPLGAMIETPAAGLCVSDLAKYVDFVSVGTNDLTQYTMAAGRENPLVNQYFNDHHPAIFKLLQFVCDSVPDKPVSLCGELAGDEASVAQVLRTGICGLSVAPPLLPTIKEAVRKVRLGI